MIYILGQQLLLVTPDHVLPGILTVTPCRQAFNGVCCMHEAPCHAMQAS